MDKILANEKITKDEMLEMLQSHEEKIKVLEGHVQLMTPINLSQAPSEGSVPQYQQQDEDSIPEDILNMPLEERELQELFDLLDGSKQDLGYWWPRAAGCEPFFPTLPCLNAFTTRYTHGSSFSPVVTEGIFSRHWEITLQTSLLQETARANGTSLKARRVPSSMSFCVGLCVSFKRPTTNSVFCFKKSETLSSREKVRWSN